MKQDCSECLLNELCAYRRDVESALEKLFEETMATLTEIGYTEAMTSAWDIKLHKIRSVCLTHLAKYCRYFKKDAKKQQG